MKRFSNIGAARNAGEGLMVLDQFDTTHTILHSYNDTHPNALPHIPSNKELFVAVFFRFQPDERLNACAKIWQKKFDDPTTVYIWAVESLELRQELAKRKLRANVITSPNPPPPRSNMAAGMSDQIIDSTMAFSGLPPIPDFTNPNTQYQYNYQVANQQLEAATTYMQYGLFLDTPNERQPTPTFQSNQSQVYPYSRPNPAWPQNTNGSDQPRCRSFPFCTWRNCNFIHTEDPVLVAIQEESYRQQLTTIPGQTWFPDATLIARYNSYSAPTYTTGP